MTYLRCEECKHEHAHPSEGGTVRCELCPKCAAERRKEAQ